MIKELLAMIELVSLTCFAFVGLGMLAALVSIFDRWRVRLGLLGALNRVGLTGLFFVALWLAVASVPSVRGGLIAATEYLVGGPVFFGGDCRIKNSDLTNKAGGTVYLGEVGEGGGRYSKHVWGVNHKGEIIDEVCPPSTKGCSPRRVFATVDFDGKVEVKDPVAKVMIDYETTRRALRAWTL